MFASLWFLRYHLHKLIFKRTHSLSMQLILFKKHANFSMLIILMMYQYSLLIYQGTSHHPHAGIFMSSDTPKEREPMKSFRVVRSQSHTSTDNLLSLSVGFNLLQRRKEQQMPVWYIYKTYYNENNWGGGIRKKIFNLQGKCFIPIWIKSGADSFCFLFTFILWIWYKFQLHVRIWKSIWIHRN